MCLCTVTLPSVAAAISMLYLFGLLSVDLVHKFVLFDFEIQVVLRVQSRAEVRRRAEKQC